MLGVTSFLIITFEPIDDLDEQELRDKDPPVELDELENGQEMDTTMGITEGKGEIEEQWKNREIGCKIDTPSLADNLTTVLTTNLTAGPTIVAPELTVAPEPIIAPALTDTPELTTDVDNQELRAGDTLVELDGQAPTKIGKESLVVISTGITSKTSSGTTTTKTGIERSRFDAYQRLPEPVSASAFASAPASAICKPGANPNEMSDERGANDHREDSLWDNHREDFCQSDFGRWHKWKEKPQEAKIINDKRSEYRDSGDIIFSPDLALFPPVLPISPPVSASSPPGSTPISPLAAPSVLLPATPLTSTLTRLSDLVFAPPPIPPPDLALAPSVSPPASAPVPPPALVSASPPPPPSDLAPAPTPVLSPDSLRLISRWRDGWTESSPQ
jgi:hypothetical protein